MIKHYPITNTETVIKHYSEKDGIPINYVCTTDLKLTDHPVDIFYRSTPHPVFNNRYFGLMYSSHCPNDKSLMILNADQVEDFAFGIVEDDDGYLQYSTSLHDYKQFANGNMIDGGREYIRSSPNVKIYVVRDGKMVNKDE